MNTKDFIKDNSENICECLHTKRMHRNSGLYEPDASISQYKIENCEVDDCTCTKYISREAE